MKGTDEGILRAVGTFNNAIICFMAHLQLAGDSDTSLVSIMDIFWGLVVESLYELHICK